MEKRGTPPISQKHRPLALFINTGFADGLLGTLGSLLGGALGGVIAGALGDLTGVDEALTLTLPVGMPWGYVFWLRPEEVVYSHPTRASVVQTLGGAWVDDFGEGLVDITLSGHTGWHYRVGGEPAFYALRNGCFQLYHQLRMAAADAGQDPDSVQMLFVDTLHAAAYVVYPESLQTRKHKTRPLLYQYQLRLKGLMRFA
jgi:hypothetical protein